MSASTQMLVIMLCLLSGAFFAGMETGMLSLNRLRLRHLVRRRIPTALLADRILNRPELLLGTTLIGTNLSYVIVSVYATRLATDGFGSAGPFIASAAITLVVLVGCEYLPKAWFQSFPAQRVLPLAPLLHFFSRILYPLSWLLHQAFRRLLPVPDESSDSPAGLITREELFHLTREGMETGMLTREESRMIHGVFSLGRRTCGECMIPLERVICVPYKAAAEQIKDIARRHGFSRYPVRRAGSYGVVGILHLRDVLSRSDSQEGTAGFLMRPPLRVSAHMPVDHVLPRMRATGSPLFLVTDTRQEVIGILTVEEVLAEIMGGM